MPAFLSIKMQIKFKNTTGPGPALVSDLKGSNPVSAILRLNQREGPSSAISSQKGFHAFSEILWLASKPGASQTFLQFATAISTEGTGVCTTAGSQSWQGSG